MNIYWDLLKKNQEKFQERRIETLFQSDKDRFKEFTIEIEDLYFDYSKTNIDSETLKILKEYAQNSKIMKRIDAMFKGEKINVTEKRSALHTALRNFKTNDIKNLGEINKKLLVRFKAISKFCDQIRTGQIKSGSGFKFTDVVNIGIGGSELGPKLVTNALSEYHSGPRIHFVANIDSYEISNIIKDLDPNKTLFIISSKSFTTIETIKNAKTALRWVCSALGSNGVKNFIAVCSSNEKALDFGVLKENIFEFDEWVGGRFSVWGPIGLPVMLAIGVDLFEKFLEGASQIDHHFKNKEVSQNLPIILGLVGFWHSTICQYTSRAILPYESKLEYFPTYLQQLDMESNGKSVNLNGDRIYYPTTPVTWGQIGTNNQHAFFQFLHQSNQIIPCEFILGANCFDNKYYEDHHLQLIVNCLAQSEALMFGLKNKVKIEGNNDQHFSCIGNRPSTILIYRQITPKILGKLLALFEHRTFSEGLLWNVNSFDQWGVELGKNTAKKLTKTLFQKDKYPNFSKSTLNLLNKIKKLKKF